MPHEREFEAISYASLVGLLKANSNWVVTDLSMGAWLGQWCARELCSQLGIAAEAESSLAIPALPRAFAHAVALLIDEEARSNVAVLRSYRNAKLVAENLAFHRIAVVCPLDETSWGQDNLSFLTFLAENLSQDSVAEKIVLAFPRKSAIRYAPCTWQVQSSDLWETEGEIERGTTVALVPGVVWLPGLNSSLRDELSEYELGIALPRNHALISPKHRQLLTDLPHYRFSQLALTGGIEPWLRAYAHRHGHRDCASPELLASEATSRSLEGAPEISLLLAKSAFQAAKSPREVVTTYLTLQGRLIADGHYAELAAMPSFLSFDLAEAKWYHLQNKGWGLVMIGNLDEAVTYFNESIASYPGKEDDVEFLYLLNISSLCLFKKGFIEEALEREHRIENTLSRRQIVDWAIYYINCFNLARLYRFRAETAKSYKYFRSAFSTSAGSRSDNEMMYLNFICGSANADIDSERFACLLRAAIHWLAMEVPESIPARVASSILRSTPKPESVVEEISRELYEQIVAHVPAIEPLVADQIIGICQWDPREDGAPRQSLVAISGKGWGLVGSNAHYTNRICNEQYKRLLGLVGAIILEQSSTPSIRSIHVGVLSGNEIPVDERELKLWCVLHNVQQIDLDQRRLPLDGPEVESFLQSTRVRRNSGVVSSVIIDGIEILRFKRHQKTVALSPIQQQLFRSIDSSAAVWDVLRQGNERISLAAISVLKELDGAGVVSFDFN